MSHHVLELPARRDEILQRILDRIDQGWNY